jgi:hypothetical protein
MAAELMQKITGGENEKKFSTYSLRQHYLHQVQRVFSQFSGSVKSEEHPYKFCRTKVVIKYGKFKPEAQ